MKESAYKKAKMYTQMDIALNILTDMWNDYPPIRPLLRDLNALKKGIESQLHVLWDNDED
jgi:hypothetical protein